MIEFRDLGNCFDDVQFYKNGTEFKAKCPCHNDKNNSLHATKQKNRILLNCLAGCKVNDILKTRNLRLSDLGSGQIPTKRPLPERIAWGKRKRFGDGVKVTAIYDYQNAEGSYVYSNVRFEGGTIENKTFMLYRINYAEQSFSSGIGDIERVPYRLPEVLKGIGQGLDIYVTEGEKDSETARSLGFVATTTGGATTWKPSIAKWFKGASIIILPDNDSAGQLYVESILRDLRKVCTRFKIVKTSTAPKGDLTDYIVKEGHSKAELEALIKLIPWTECGAAAEPVGKVAMENNSLVTVHETPPVQLEYTSDGKTAQTIRNFCEVLEHDQKINHLLRFNEFSMRTEIDGPTWWRRYERGFTDADANELRMYIESEYGLKKMDSFFSAIDIVSRRHPFHPVKEWIKAQKRTDENRLGNVFKKYLGAPNTRYVEEVEKVFFFGAIARIYQPGSKFDTCPVLISREQGSGKSSIARFLAGQDEFFTDAVLNLDSAKTVEALSGHWVCEIPEMLGTVNARTVESIKSFLSRVADTYRTPYARTPQTIQRQSVFIGTSNELSVLPADQTGNRRFLPIRCFPENAVVHPLADEAETRAFIGNAYAEALELYKRGEYSLLLSRDVEIDAEQERQSATPEDTLKGEIEEYLDNLPSGTRVCTKQIYFDGLGHDSDTDFPRDWELRQIARTLDGIQGWKRGPTNHRFETYGRQRFWEKTVNGENKDNMETTNKPESVDTSFHEVVTSDGYIPFS